MHGSWNKGESEKYLEVVGVSNWIISRVKKNFDKYKNGNLDIESEEAISVWPDLWDKNYDADIFIETP